LERRVHCIRNVAAKFESGLPTNSRAIGPASHSCTTPAASEIHAGSPIFPPESSRGSEIGPPGSPSALGHIGGPLYEREDSVYSERLETGLRGSEKPYRAGIGSDSCSCAWRVTHDQSGGVYLWSRTAHHKASIPFWICVGAVQSARLVAASNSSWLWFTNLHA